MKKETTLNELLNKYNLSIDLFNKLSYIEKLTELELSDLDYIEDRIIVWKEMEIF